MIAYLQIRNQWLPVAVAASKGAGLLQWSESTWRRAVVEAERLGWLERQVRSGRVKGNRRGYNPGSLYRVIWSMLPGGRPSVDGGGPLVAVTTGGRPWQRSAGNQPIGGRDDRRKPDGSSGSRAANGDETPPLNNGRIPEPSQPNGQPSQNGHLPNSEPSHGFQEPSQVFDLRTQSNLDPVLPTEGTLRQEVEGRRQLGAPATLSGNLMPPAVTRSSDPPPTPQGGAINGRGDAPCPPDVAAQVKSATWYRGRR